MYLFNNAIYCIFNSRCIIPVLLTTKYRLFRNFNFLMFKYYVFHNECVKIYQPCPLNINNEEYLYKHLGIQYLSSLSVLRIRQTTIYILRLGRVAVRVTCVILRSPNVVTQMGEKNYSSLVIIIKSV